MYFNEKLQKLRKEHKLSQEQLADMLDVTRQSVSKWESGTTYPEMDKLITMCKIFKCSLDDLTNDEVTEINSNNKKNTQFTNVIDGLLSMLEKTIKMFGAMKFGQKIKCVSSLILLGAFLLIFKIPFEIIENGFYNIVSNIGRPAIESFLSGTFNFVVDIIYFALYVMVYGYIYKVAYLDKYEFIKGNSKVEKIIIEEPKFIKEKNEIVIEKGIKEENAIFHLIGKFLLGFIKFLVLCFAIPLMMILVILFAMLAVDVYLLFRGVIYLGILFGLIFSIIMSVVFLEVFIRFIFNKKASFKRLLCTFIISLGGLGVSSGILALEISNTVFIDEMPNKIDTKQIDKVYSMSENLVIGNEISFLSRYCEYYDYYNVEIEYIADETLSDNVKLEADYYSDFINIKFMEDDFSIGLDSSYVPEMNFAQKLINLTIENLADKKIYNYSMLEHVTLRVYSSSKNIEVLKNNVGKIIEEERKNDLMEEAENERNYYEVQIENYENQIDEYTNKISEQEREIESLKEENSELKEKIEEYKRNIESILGE